MAQALYRKYRSRSLDDVVGQGHITKTLKNALKSGRISHAYLFTGPRGVGKTSVARILAHEVNQLDYSDEAIHLDIIEIDAASNRRIDEIRDLRDRVRIAPTSAKYKVYIIDEVHMLTREAFNALLKTLEEPPAHCIFILATTEAHKLPETIISRTQRFEFKPVSISQAAEHLGSIAEREKLIIDKGALTLLAEFGNGSFRDSISYLDQLSSLGRAISENDVRELLGLPAAREIDKLLKALDSANPAEILDLLKVLEEKGVNPQAIASALSSKLRGLALENKLDTRKIGLMKSMVEVSQSSRPKETLEISLLETSLSEMSKTESVNKPAVQSTEKINDKKSVASANTGSDAIVAKASGFNLGMWDEIVERSKAEAASIYTALRLARPEYYDGKLTLNFRFPLHQKKMEQVKNKDMVIKLIKNVTGSVLELECVIQNEQQPITVDNAEPLAQPAASISNIFGSAEVLEA